MKLLDLLEVSQLMRGQQPSLQLCVGGAVGEGFSKMSSTNLTLSLGRAATRLSNFWPSEETSRRRNLLSAYRNQLAGDSDQNAGSLRSLRELSARGG